MFIQVWQITDADGPVAVRRDGSIAWLVFNRPAAGNAMNAQMMTDLRRTWIELDRAPDVGAIVVTGAGSSFQTGLDMVQLSRNPDALREMSRRTKRAELGLTGWHCGVGKPIVTAVNGVCAGGGLHFVADSDVVIAASTATFVDPHVTVGQASVFEPIGLARRAAFGPVVRMALIGAGERVSASRARQLGWIGEVVAPEELIEAATSIARRMAAHPATALSAVKRALWQAFETTALDTRAKANEEGESS